MASGTERTVSVVVHGRVQGVGYRAWISARTEKLGLNGHVRNRADGTVEASFSGPEEIVSAMIDACRQGPPSARVADVEVAEAQSPPAQAGFVILDG